MKNDKTPAKKRIKLDKDVIADLEATGADAEVIRGGLSGGGGTFAGRSGSNTS